MSIRSNLSQEPPPYNDHLPTMTTILWPHDQNINIPLTNPANNLGSREWSLYIGLTEPYFKNHLRITTTCPQKPPFWGSDTGLTILLPILDLVLLCICCRFWTCIAKKMISKQHPSVNKGRKGVQSRIQFYVRQPL